MGIQEIIREMGGGLVSYFSGLIGVIVFGYTFYKVIKFAVRLLL